MPKVCYQHRNFRRDALGIIDQANLIIDEYLAEGYKLTLRQLYYQFVSRDLIPNKQSEYKRLGSVINDARLAGMIDWEAIEDRTRNLESLPHWTSPSEIIESCAEQFNYDRWAGQPHRIEVWIEKEALAGVFERICRSLDVPYFCCRGYTSQSEMWVAAMRLQRYEDDGQRPIILHFGDHDPSGIDMTRDIRERLELFGCNVDVRRLALNHDQIKQYNPPPNPAKETDSRFEGYMALHGDESWELDALEPRVLSAMVNQNVTALRDGTMWFSDTNRQNKARAALARIAEDWSDDD
jgi:hypothetical protein